MVIGEKLRRVICAKNLDELSQANEFEFDLRGLTELNHQMLEMSQLAHVEAEDILIVRDIISYSYDRITYIRSIWLFAYTFLYVVPFAVQLLIGAAQPETTRILNLVAMLT